MPRKSMKLSSIAYEQLRAMITEMPAGQYLSARSYAKDLRMSYTPVREAFLLLQNEGVLRQVPNVGFFVASLDLADILQIFQVRECIEVYALEKVFCRLRPEHLQQMRTAWESQQEAFRQENHYRMMTADGDFHRIPLEVLGNTLLLNQYDSVRSRYMLCTARLAAMAPDLGTEGNRKILELIEVGNKETATAALAAHIAEMRQNITDSYVSRSF